MLEQRLLYFYMKDAHPISKIFPKNKFYFYVTEKCFKFVF